jgi:hypothetical protein
VAALVRQAGLDVLEDWTAQIRARAPDEGDVAAAPPRRGPVWHVPAERSGTV